MEFPQKLLMYRKKAKLSQKQLAQKAGVSQSSINYWEKGERTPGFEQISKLSTALNIPFLALFSDPLTLDGDDTPQLKLVDTSEEITDNAFIKIVEGIYGRCKTINVDVFQNDEYKYSSAYVSVGRHSKKLFIHESDWDALQELICDMIKKIIPLIGTKETLESLNEFKETDSDRVETLEESDIKMYMSNDFRPYQKVTNDLYSQFVNNNNNKKAIQGTAQQKKGIELEPPEVMAAHDRTDVEITPEGRQHDLDLMNDDNKQGIGL